MRASMRSLPTLAVFCLGLACSTAALSNPVMVPEPARIRTEEELRGELQGDSYKDYARATPVLMGLWDGRRGIAMEALQSQHDRVRKAAIHCLARIGDSDALVSLRAVLVDTSASFEVRKEAAAALSHIGDQSSVPLIERVVAELGVDIGPDGKSSDGSILKRLYQYSFEMSLERLQRPDLGNPLLTKGEHFIGYRFLVDDIESVSVVKNAFMGYPPELARRDQQQVRELPASDHRRICDLLQDGQYEYPGMITDGVYLVIRLVDGREVVLVKNREIFCLSTRDRAWVDGFCVRASELAAYIDAALVGMNEATPEGAASRESSN